MTEDTVGSPFFSHLHFSRLFQFLILRDHEIPQKSGDIICHESIFK